MKTRVLVTAFEPYDIWSENASWLALVELTRQMPGCAQVTTRRYPVDFSGMRACLEKDLAANFDYALHVGQAPGSAVIQLESIAINVGQQLEQHPDEYQTLVGGGPVAYRSPLPLGSLAGALRQAGLPARVSYHAGTYLCNATLYVSLHLARQRALKTQATFVHLPLETAQVVQQPHGVPSLPRELSANALRVLLQWLGKRDVSTA